VVRTYVFCEGRPLHRGQGGVCRGYRGGEGRIRPILILEADVGVEVEGERGWANRELSGCGWMGAFVSASPWIYS